jgi:hypothetical protein
LWRSERLAHRYGLKFSASVRPQKEQYADLAEARKLFIASFRSWPEVAAGEAETCCLDAGPARSGAPLAPSEIVASVI